VRIQTRSKRCGRQELRSVARSLGGRFRFALRGADIPGAAQYLRIADGLLLHGEKLRTAFQGGPGVVWHKTDRGLGVDFQLKLQ